MEQGGRHLNEPFDGDLELLREERHCAWNCAVVILQSMADMEDS